jgi:hypothetical protein
MVDKSGMVRYVGYVKKTPEHPKFEDALKACGWFLNGGGL